MDVQLVMELVENEKGTEVNVNPYPAPYKTQLFKMIGNKQRMAHNIIRLFPSRFGKYFEPFLGSGGVLGVLSPQSALGSDTYKPLIDIWKALKSEPETLKDWYTTRWYQAMTGDKVEEYEKIKASFNASPNGADYIFLCRSCYGGVVRFRMKDGYMSTPCGAHRPVHPETFSERVDAWYARVRDADFEQMAYEEAMAQANAGDLIYCDPPYSHSQAILYGAQRFSLGALLETIGKCKERGVFVALSIDGSKKSGGYICNVAIPEGLFECEVAVTVGRSMLRRFQMGGETLEKEVVKDRLLLTYDPYSVG